MKRIFLILLLLSGDLIARPWAATETANPIKDYADFHGLNSRRVIFKWDVELNNDGKKVMLLDTKLTPTEIQEEQKETKSDYNPNIKNFTVYIPNPAKADYIQSKGLYEDGVLGVGGGMSVDVTQCYVGYIVQIKKWGLVTIESESATDKVPAEARIYAYTIEGDHIKRGLLAIYNPVKEKNSIYEQYLSESKRTKVQLQEVTL